ncbi:MAG: hypothetical protein ACTHNM_17225 [Dyella sp.]|uniref:hypothetical protein n=1 Tax=Dyella sp. TaxID=1869338 RepID=UPI003F7D68C1
MKLSLIGYALLALALVGGAAEWHGHSRGYASGYQDATDHDDKRVQDMQGERDLANANRDAANASLNNVRQLLATQRERMQAQAAMFDAVMANRDALQKKLDTYARERQSNVVKVGHEDPQCADLARLPVCPAVAERLWGKAAGDPVPAAASH